MQRNDPHYIHETIVRDVMDVIDGIKDEDFLKDTSSKTSFRSVASATSNLTLVFPVLISDSINIDSAGIICKAIERKAATMLQMLFSAYSISNASDAIDYLKQFHNNINIRNGGMTIDTFIDTLDDLYDIASESTVHESAMEKTAKIVREIEMKSAVEEDCKNNINYTLPDSVSEESLNIYKFTNNSNKPIVFSEANKKNNNGPRNYNTTATNYYGYGSEPEVMDHSMHMHDDHDNLKFDTDKLTFDFSNHTTNKYADDTEKRKNLVDARLKTTEYFNKQLIPTDVKKANELVPTMMSIHFTSVNPDNGEPVAINDVLIGIKAKLYPLSSMDVVNRITVKNKDRNGFNKFLRATTREISFFKDFLFAIDKAKIDAVSQSKRGSSSKFWKVLERRALKSKIRRNLRMTNDATAISTLVVSKEEVEYLKKTENINIENPSIIRPIMESYNLLGVVIVDETQEIASFIFDSGDDMYEQISFKNLERESNDDSSRKIINLMTKIAR